MKKIISTFIITILFTACKYDVPPSEIIESNKTTDGETPAIMESTTTEETIFIESTTAEETEFVTIGDESFPVNLTELEKIFCNSNEDILEISKMKELVKLHFIIGFMEPDLSPLVELTNLTHLRLFEPGGIEFDISPLANLPNLKSLSISSHSITDISALSEFTNIIELYLTVRALTNISPLAELYNLEKLLIGPGGRLPSELSDISPLDGLINLTYLSLWNNRISDISPLINLTNLEYLDISNNPLSESQVNELKEKLPNCKIYSKYN